MNKQSVIYFSLGIALFFITSLLFCKSKSATSTVIDRDTSRILGCYVDGKKKEINYAVLYMITKDTFQFREVDSSTQKKQWAKDTAFFVPQSIEDTATKKISVAYIPVIRQSVSIERNFDTAVSILQNFVKNNPQYFPKPDVTAIKTDTSATKKNK